MHTTNPREIFFKGTHGVGRQDKKPPGRFRLGLSEPQTAVTTPETATTLPQNRPSHHGSETRQTAYIAGRVPFHIKTEVNRIGAPKGWSESYTVRTLVEQALAQNFGESFAVMLRNTIQEAVRTEIRKEGEWLRKITMSCYSAAEQSRLHATDLHRLLIPPKEDINKKIRDHRENSYKHLKFYFRSISVLEEQFQWPSSK